MDENVGSEVLSLKGKDDGTMAGVMTIFSRPACHTTTVNA